MNKALNVFAILGLIVIGLLIGLLLPRPMTEHERGSAGIRVMPGKTEPQTPPVRERFSLLPKPSIVGRWGATIHVPENGQSSLPMPAHDTEISCEFLKDGTYIEVSKDSMFNNYPEREIGTWKEIEGNRVIIDKKSDPNELYIYSIDRDNLSLRNDNKTAVYLKRM